MNPISLMLQALNLGKRLLCQIGVREVDGDAPAWIVERANLDTVSVLPVTIALRVIPFLQLLKRVHVVNVSSGLTVEMIFSASPSECLPAGAKFSSGAHPCDRMSFILKALSSILPLLGPVKLREPVVYVSGMAKDGLLLSGAGALSSRLPDISVQLGLMSFKLLYVSDKLQGPSRYAHLQCVHRAFHSRWGKVPPFVPQRHPLQNDPLLCCNLRCKL
jgi:hypothetical protein